MFFECQAYLNSNGLNHLKRCKANNATFGVFRRYGSSRLKISFQFNANAYLKCKWTLLHGVL